MKKALSILALCAAGLTSAPAAGASSPTSLSALSAPQIVTLSLHNAAAEGSCTNVANGSAVGFTFGSTTNSGPTEAQQIIHFNKATGEALLLKGVAYIKLSATVINLEFAKPFPQYANKWISLTSARKEYASITTGLLFSSMLTQVRPAGNLTRSKVVTLNGVKVVAITGTANAALGLSAGKQTLFVRATAPYLPVAIDAAGRSQGVPTNLTVTFSNWGKKFSYAVPSPVVAISSTTLP